MCVVETDGRIRGVLLLPFPGSVEAWDEEWGFGGLKLERRAQDVGAVLTSLASRRENQAL